MKKLPLILSILISVVVIGGAIVFAQNRGGDQPQTANNVSTEGEKQVVELQVKGGYMPKLTTAKGGIPTILRMKTDGTFDCSAGVTIPSIGYRKTLPQTGVTEVEIPAQKAGTTLEGVCLMGMYYFSISFT